MKFVHNDGGRKAAGFQGVAGDCVARAIAIATQKPYEEVYRALADGAGKERNSKGRSARNGVHTKRLWFKRYMESIGWKWTPTMSIGSGCTVHLKDGELPMGRLVVAVSKHYTAVIDGVIHDTHDPTDRGVTIYPPGCSMVIPKGAYLLSNGNGWAYRPDRCVYGYWKKL
jgi:hypothetical protein